MAEFRRRRCATRSLAFDKVGNLYVDDFSNNRVLEYDGAGTTATKEFGQGTAGSDFTDNSCNNGGVTANSLCQPNGVGVDGSNNVYISDSSNNRILEYNETTASNTPKSPNNFTANEAFGQGGVFTSNSCNGGGVNSTTLCNPVGLSFDSTGDLLAADFSNSRMLLYSTPASNTTATTVFGQGASFSSSICNVNGNAPSPETLCNPDDPIGDATGNIVLSDQANNRTLFYPGPFSATPLIAAPDTAAASSAISSSRITVSARQLKFAATRVNRESKPAKFTVTNAGNAPVQILTVEATGRDFELLNQCAGPLPAGGSCTVTVKLKPITTGQRGGEIVITDNTLQGPQAVRVSGRATR
jgi:hypothetical protein